MKNYPVLSGYFKQKSPRYIGGEVGVQGKLPSHVTLPFFRTNSSYFSPVTLLQMRS